LIFEIHHNWSGKSVSVLQTIGVQRSENITTDIRSYKHQISAISTLMEYRAVGTVLYRFEQFRIVYMYDYART